MSTKAFRRLGPLAAGAWVTLLVGGLFSPASARAGCSHYAVARGHGPGASALGLDLLGPLNEVSTHAPASAPRKPASPCAGLSCSRDPMPPTVPAPAGTWRVEAWACLDTPLPPPLSPAVGRAPEHAPGRPVRVASRPERPPRSA